jgi:hypothetical protein
MLQNIEIGEIIRIENKEYIITKTKIGNSEKERVNIKLLKEAIIRKIYRKKYFKNKKQN